MHCRCLFVYTNNLTRCGNGNLVVEGNKELKSTTHGIKILLEISDKMPTVNNEEMKEFNKEKHRMHYRNMMCIHDRYKEMVKRKKEPLLYSNRTKYFFIPQILKAKENYDVTEVLEEYETEWYIFKSKLYEFKAMKNNRGCYNSSYDLKDWSVQLFTTDKRKKVRYESYIPKMLYPEKLSMITAQATSRQ